MDQAVTGYKLYAVGMLRFEAVTHGIVSTLIARTLVESRTGIEVARGVDGMAIPGPHSQAYTSVSSRHSGRNSATENVLDVPSTISLSFAP